MEYFLFLTFHCIKNSKIFPVVKKKYWKFFSADTIFRWNASKWGRKKKIKMKNKEIKLKINYLKTACEFSMTITMQYKPIGSNSFTYSDVILHGKTKSLDDEG